MFSINLITVYSFATVKKKKKKKITKRKEKVEVKDEILRSLAEDAEYEKY